MKGFPSSKERLLSCIVMIGATSWWCAMVDWPKLYHKTITWKISLSILRNLNDTCPTWNLGLLWWFRLAIRVKTISSTFSGFHVTIFIKLRTHASFKTFWFTSRVHTPASELGPKVLRASFGRFCDAILLKQNKGAPAKYSHVFIIFRGCWPERPHLSKLEQKCPMHPKPTKHLAMPNWQAETQVTTPWSDI